MNLVHTIGRDSRCVTARPGGADNLNVILRHARLSGRLCQVVRIRMPVTVTGTVTVTFTVTLAVTYYRAAPR